MHYARGLLGAVNLCNCQFLCLHQSTHPVDGSGGIIMLLGCQSVCMCAYTHNMAEVFSDRLARQLLVLSHCVELARRSSVYLEVVHTSCL